MKNCYVRSRFLRNSLYCPSWTIICCLGGRDLLVLKARLAVSKCGFDQHDVGNVDLRRIDGRPGTAPRSNK